MPRLFVAVNLDDATAAAVGVLSQTLRIDPRIQKAGRASWVRPDRMHLTLHFEAEADEGTARLMHEALESAIPVAPFRLSFAGLGMFPERGAPRVLWLGIAEGKNDLALIHGEIARRLRTGGSSGRSEPFRPHLTLARFRDPVRRGGLAGLEGVRAAAGPSIIDRVTLYESRLSPKGPAYTALAQALLKGTQ